MRVDVGVRVGAVMRRLPPLFDDTIDAMAAGVVIVVLGIALPFLAWMFWGYGAATFTLVGEALVVLLLGQLEREVRR